MAVNKYVRTPITVECLMEHIRTLAKVFPNTDDFYLIMAERVFEQRLTVRETEWVVKYLIENHDGKLYIANVMELCRTIKQQRIPDEYLLRRQLTAETPSDEQKGGKF